MIQISSGASHRVYQLWSYLLDLGLLLLHLPGAGDDQLARALLLLAHRLPHVLALLTGVRVLQTAARLQRHRLLRPRPQHGGGVNLKVG